MTQANEGPRARYRRQVRDEVQERAWEQITQGGAAGLSLKAIATRMGMTAPALYRYYGSRDELLTQLILSTYQDLAETIENADAHRKTGSALLTEIARALRTWALGHPQRYLLLYGTPVPGYHAPEDATRLAQRIFAPILSGFAAPPPDGVAESAAAASHRALTFWTRLHGVLSLELAGHFAGMNVDTDQLYQDEVQSLLTSTGSTTARSTTARSTTARSTAAWKDGPTAT